MTKKEHKQYQFKPKIVSFVCNWSAYAILREKELQFSEDMHFIRVMCLGRINPSFIFKAFELGADGVLLLGCPSGECHYSFGNKIAEEHLDTAVRVAHLLGIEKERLGLVPVSVEGDTKFIKSVNKFIKEVKKRGPSPLKESVKGE